MSVPINSLHKEVKKRLMDKDMTQVQLAEQLGISPAYLNDILQGKREGDYYILRSFKILDMNIFQSVTAGN